MSKRETPLTRKYWKSIGGTLIEEFPAVGKNDSVMRQMCKEFDIEVVVYSVNKK